MSLSENKKVVRAYSVQVVRGGDFSGADRLLASDVVFTSPYTPKPVRGVERFKAMIDALRTAFPDLRIEEADILAEGDRVATRWVASGTQRGPFGALPPSGRRFSITGMSIYRLRGGRIVEGWVNDDNLGMMQQLGAIPLAEGTPR